MNPIKEQLRKESAEALNKANISWESLNNDTHWKIGKIDFWPTTGKWACAETSLDGYDVDGMIKHINRPRRGAIAKVLTVEEMFDIAKRVRPLSLHGVCEVLHKEVYKKGEK